MRHLVNAQENDVDKGINQHLAVGLPPHVQLAETVEPEDQNSALIFGFARFPQAILVSISSFVASSSSRRAFVDLARKPLYGVQQILNGRVRFPQLLFIQGQVHIFSILQIHSYRYDGLKGGTVHHHLHGFAGNQIFTLFYAGRFLVALNAFFSLIVSGVGRSAPFFEFWKGGDTGCKYELRRHSDKTGGFKGGLSSPLAHDLACRV